MINNRSVEWGNIINNHGRWNKIKTRSGNLVYFHEEGYMDENGIKIVDGHFFEAT